MDDYESEAIEYAPFINDKNILVLDDTIASGKTISEACKIIIESFTPKSITVITLFSKL
jgi:hypoxanthine-guanine phosphoribosyltransferase